MCDYKLARCSEHQELGMRITECIVAAESSGLYLHSTLTPISQMSLIGSKDNDDQIRNVGKVGMTQF